MTDFHDYRNQHALGAHRQRPHTDDNVGGRVLIGLAVIALIIAGVILWIGDGSVPVADEERRPAVTAPIPVPAVPPGD